MKNALTIAAVLLSCYGLWAPEPVAWSSWVGYLAGVLVLELRAVPLPGLGWVSMAPAFVLAAALTPSVGPIGALLLLALGWAARCLAAPRVDVWTGLLMEAVPGLASVALIKALTQVDSELSTSEVGLAAALIWAVLISVVPGQLLDDLVGQEKWIFARSSAWPSLASLGLVAIAASLLSQQAPGRELFLLFPLLLMQSLVKQAVENPSVSEYRAARHRLMEAVTRGKMLTATLLETEQQAEATSAGLELVKSFTERLGKNDSLQGLWSALDAEIRQQAELRSTALFLPREGQLRLVFVDSPDAAAAQAASQRGQSEPAVARCWSDGRPLYTRRAPPGARLFSGDEAAAAVGFGPGILYLGKASAEPFSAHQKSLVELLAGHAGNLVAAMLRREAEREALSSSQRALGELTEWSGRLSALLNGARVLAGTLDPEVLKTQLEDVMNGLFGAHTGCFYRLTERGLEFYHGWPAGAVQREAMAPVASRIVTSGRSWSVAEVSQAGLEPMAPGQRSLLGVPVESQHGMAGVLLLGRSEPPQADDEEFLYLVGLMLAVAYRGADIHWQLKTSQEQLVQAGKLAAVGQLAAGVAHELNTPLGTVLLSLEGAERALTKRPDRVPERLERARRAVEHAQRITSNLLVFARNEAGDYQPLDLKETVQASLETLRGQAALADIVWQEDLRPTGLVRGSSVELGQLLLQLVSNGVDAARQAARPALRVSTWREGNDVVLTVADNGPGIEAEVAQRMFEPFFTTKPVGHGTGLGLSTCREIAVRHRGTLEFRPQARGALFELRLPGEAP